MIVLYWWGLVDLTQNSSIVPAILLSMHTHIYVLNGEKSLYLLYTDPRFVHPAIVIQNTSIFLSVLFSIGERNTFRNLF